MEEYNYYLNYYRNCEVYSATPDFYTIKSEYDRYFSKFSGRVKSLDFEAQYSCSLFYTIFLDNAFNYLPIFQRNNIPFIFTLYPGGGFALCNNLSNTKLKTVANSPYLQKIITTQKITYDYLLSKKFITPEKVEFIYGGVLPSQFFLTSRIPKKYFQKDKATFDICFVAYKYMEKGTDKGYDTFIEVAKKLATYSKNIRFHVVGSFNKDEIDITDIHSQITFYKPQYREFFQEFYSGMDIILSPNLPFLLRPGSFDGFPTGSCVEAGLAGVAVFCTDELKLNPCFVDREDICIIPKDSNEIVDIILSYFHDLEGLYKLAQNCKDSFHRIFGLEEQMSKRIAIFKKYL